MLTRVQSIYLISALSRFHVSRSILCNTSLYDYNGINYFAYHGFFINFNNMQQSRNLMVIKGLH